MPDLPVVPTDRLYKFKAVGGLIGIILVAAAVMSIQRNHSAELSALVLTADSLEADTRLYLERVHEADSLRRHDLLPSCPERGELMKRAAVLRDRGKMLEERDKEWLM